MNIVLLNGSPKGSESVTLQFAMYLAAQKRLKPGMVAPYRRVVRDTVPNQ